ncbi:helix-turn-helix domain-containing protein [Amycolatopsis suaedae]|uniref:helix-turn-helix domain-containing protein n=1 Tax=Amycolatopsis suaedae TaxID=2510978 RepID=UPI0013EF3913|nr:helix-turn-helix domain-containing protein [Amycolatopsis suaedae]
MTSLPVLPGEAAAWLDSAAPSATPGIDPRIGQITAALHENPAAHRAAADLAHDVGLSESRLPHLFRSETGTTLRSYRTWARMLHGARCVGRGGSLTAAAAESGFASPSHLADRFRQTFGTTASTLLGRGLRIHLMD